MGSYLKQDVDQLEMVQHQAAVSSRGTTGLETRLKVCMGCMLLELNLPTLQERRKQQLTTFDEVVEGHITALPLGNSLMAADRNHRRTHLTISNPRVAVLTTPSPDTKSVTLMAARLQAATLSSTRAHSL